MINNSIFKAYDVRGKYPDEINERVVFEIAGKLPKILGKKIIVGHDARLSSPALYQAAIQGLYHSNVLKDVRMKIVEAGMITTPMLYFLVNELKAGGGIMVTASHNPKEFNGLKIVGRNAVPMSGTEILGIMNREL